MYKKCITVDGRQIRVLMPTISQTPQFEEVDYNTFMLMSDVEQREYVETAKLFAEMYANHLGETNGN